MTHTFMKLACVVGTVAACAALYPLVLFSQGEARGGEPAPEAQISNGEIRAKLYLPDAERGFYRSTRFDWSGIISSLQYKRHEYYGPWFTKSDPPVRDF